MHARAGFWACLAGNATGELPAGAPGPCAGLLKRLLPARAPRAISFHGRRPAFSRRAPAAAAAEPCRALAPRSSRLLSAEPEPRAEQPGGGSQAPGPRSGAKRPLALVEVGGGPGGGGCMGP